MIREDQPLLSLIRATARGSILPCQLLAFLSQSQIGGSTQISSLAPTIDRFSSQWTPHLCAPRCSPGGHGMTPLGMSSPPQFARGARLQVLPRLGRMEAHRTEILYRLKIRSLASHRSWRGQLRPTCLCAPFAGRPNLGGLQRLHPLGNICVICYTEPNVLEQSSIGSSTAMRADVLPLWLGKPKPPHGGTFAPL